MCWVCELPDEERRTNDAETFLGRRELKRRIRGFRAGHDLDAHDEARLDFLEALMRALDERGVDGVASS